MDNLYLIDAEPAPKIEFLEPPWFFGENVSREPVVMC
jgi:hypothetical protein